MDGLYAHQQKIIDDDPTQCGIFLGTGGGKTRVALSLSRGKTLVIAPKTQVLDKNWERENKKLGGRVALTVLSKEQLKKVHESLDTFDTVIIDEIHTFCGVTPNIRYRNKQPIPKASQVFEACHMYLNRTKPKRLYLLTATPARNPMAVWALAELLGKNWDWYKFRDTFYFKLPKVGREIYMVKKDKLDYLARLVNKLGYVGRLEDWFDVPEQTIRYHHCPLNSAQREVIKTTPLLYPDPLVLVGKWHMAENGVYDGRGGDTEKEKVIKEYCAEFDKVLVFARYTEQIEHIKKSIKDRPVYVLNGKTKDRGAVIKKAEKDTRCVVIAQSQISAGYELPSFRCTIFASCSYSSVDDVQARGRTLRANKLNKNLFVYLHSGDIDKAVIDCLKGHRDFNEKIYAEKRSKANK